MQKKESGKQCLTENDFQESPFLSKSPFLICSQSLSVCYCIDNNCESERKPMKVGNKTIDQHFGANFKNPFFC